MKTKTEYSPYKIVHHPDALHLMKLRLQPNPIHLQIVPTNICNHSCYLCWYRLKGSHSNQLFNSTDNLSYEKIIETLDSCKLLKIKSIEYTGGGNPLVYLRMYDILKETLNRKLDLALVTNGSLLTDKYCELLGESKWVRVSLDAATPITYLYIRKVKHSSFFTVIDNIKSLVKYKKKNIIGVGFVVNEDNYTEILDAATLCKNLGVDNFRISAAFQPKGYSYFEDFLKKAKYLSALAKDRLESSEFTVFNLFNDRVKNMFEGTQDYEFCPIKEVQVYLGADYNLYTCCTLAYNNHGLIGSIKNQSLYDLWRSKEKKKMYYEHNPLKTCQHPCMYQGKNEFMNYCIEDNPTHVNFV